MREGLTLEDPMAEDLIAHRMIGINRAVEAHVLRWSNREPMHHETKDGVRVMRAPIVVVQHHLVRLVDQMETEVAGPMMPIMVPRRSLPTRSLIAWTKTETARCLVMNSRRSPSSTAVI